MQSNVAATLFGSTESLNCPPAWMLLGLAAALVALNAPVIVPRDPEMSAERGRISQDVKRYDRPLAGRGRPLSTDALPGPGHICLSYAGRTCC